MDIMSRIPVLVPRAAPVIPSQVDSIINTSDLPTLVSFLQPFCFNFAVFLKVTVLSDVPAYPVSNEYYGD